MVRVDGGRFWDGNVWIDMLVDKVVKRNGDGVRFWSAGRDG